MRDLTKAEEQVMQIIWSVDKEIAIREVWRGFDEPKPAYTTVATVMNVLLNKGFLKKVMVGKTNMFTPLVSKEQYSEHRAGALVNNYFNGSFSRLASFFAKGNKLSVKELEEMMAIAKEQIEKEK